MIIDETIAYTLMTVNDRIYICSNSKLTLIDDAVLRCCSPLAGGACQKRSGHLAQIFAALSDPCARMLLGEDGAEDEVCSAILKSQLAKSQPTISSHDLVSD